MDDEVEDIYPDSRREAVATVVVIRPRDWESDLSVHGWAMSAHQIVSVVDFYWEPPPSFWGINA